MAEQSHKKILIDRLIGMLSGEIVLSDDVRHYIDSTLAPASADQLAEFLTDSDNCEAATAIELIFFPDEAMQETIEPILAETDFSAEDPSEIAASLCKRQMRAIIGFPDKRDKVALNVPAFAVRRLVDRLHLTRVIDRRLSETIKRLVPDAHAAARVRVKLRNARISQSKNQTGFLCSLIQALYNKSEDFWDCLAFAIELLEQTDPEADIYRALMAHKQFLIQSIRAAEKNRQALASNPVEALIMKGVNISSVDTEAAREKIDRIDRISVSVYGRTEFFPGLEPSEQSLDLDIRDKEDMASVLRLLS